MRSEERAQSFGEVFTPEETVEDMLSMLPQETFDPLTTFLEPSCGNGNFLVAILERKLQNISNDKTPSELKMECVLALGSIYGVDIEEENVAEARDRMFDKLRSFVGDQLTSEKDFFDTCLEIVSSNIVVGDALGGANQVSLVRYRKTSYSTVDREVFFLEQPEMDLFFQQPKPMPPILL